MKLSTFSAGGGPEIGAVLDDRILSLSRAAPGLAVDMQGLIARWPDVEGEVRRLAGDPGRETLALADVRLLAPVPRPGKIMAIGLNYADHIAETGQPTPASQIWFSKATTAVNGPFDDIQIPRVSQTVDYEAELVVVIGQGGRHIGRGGAAAAIFGYCVGNDVTERTWQFQSPQWVLGKSFDTHAPFGPWITTADEVGDPHGRGIRCLVNGEVRQDSNTRHLVFDVWAQLERLSGAMTLQPGDLIYTGTPGGVGLGTNPPRYLNPGDIVRVEIEGLGAIENRCALERAT